MLYCVVITYLTEKEMTARASDPNTFHTNIYMFEQVQFITVIQTADDMSTHAIACTKRLCRMHLD